MHKGHKESFVPGRASTLKEISFFQEILDKVKEIIRKGIFEGNAKEKLILKEIIFWKSIFWDYKQMLLA